METGNGAVVLGRAILSAKAALSQNVTAACPRESRPLCSAQPEPNSIACSADSSPTASLGTHNEAEPLSLGVNSDRDSRRFCPLVANRPVPIGLFQTDGCSLSQRLCRNALPNGLRMAEWLTLQQSPAVGKLYDHFPAAHLPKPPLSSGSQPKERLAYRVAYQWRTYLGR